MRVFIAALALCLSTACGAQEPASSIGADSQVQPARNANADLKPLAAPVSKAEPMRVSAPVVRPNILECEGVAKQGGALLCQTTPLAKVKIGRSETRADADGKVIIGFDRDAPATAKLTITHASGPATEHPISVKARDYVEQRIDGLPPSQVSEYSEADLKRIRASSARKRVGFASNQEQVFFEDGFIYPIKDFVKTSPFGSRRILNGEPKSPHYGVDIAAPLGTPIYAPADGVVGLADEDLYFEGAMVMIDHGQGLNSLYLHVNDIFVSPGDVVKRGDLIAEVGSKGRSTGPHLCWRLKWKKENLDPELLTQWPD